MKVLALASFTASVVSAANPVYAYCNMTSDKLAQRFTIRDEDGRSYLTWNIVGLKPNTQHTNRIVLSCATPTIPTPPIEGVYTSSENGSSQYVANTNAPSYSAQSVLASGTTGGAFQVLEGATVIGCCDWTADPTVGTICTPPPDDRHDTTISRFGSLTRNTLP